MKQIVTDLFNQYDIASVNSEGLNQKSILKYELPDTPSSTTLIEEVKIIHCGVRFGPR